MLKAAWSPVHIEPKKGLICRQCQWWTSDHLGEPREYDGYNDNEAGDNDDMREMDGDAAPGSAIPVTRVSTGK